MRTEEKNAIAVSDKTIHLVAARPGVQAYAVEAGMHLLDVHLGGAIGTCRVDDNPLQVAPCPPNSFTYLPASTGRSIESTRTGYSLRTLFDYSEWRATQRRLGVEIRHADPQCHAFDGAMIGTAQAIHDCLTLTRPTRFDDHHRAFVYTLVSRLVYRLSDAPPREWLVSRVRAVQRALEHIESHLDGPLPLRTLADVARLSPYHFARVFRRETGESLHQYVLQRRVHTAEQLLVETAESLAQIAYRAGFGSQSHMTRVFKKLIGRTPTEVRNQ